MINTNLQGVYNNVLIRENEPISLPLEEALRVEIDSSNKLKDKLFEFGLRMVDRTIGVKIPLKSLPDLSKKIRFQVDETKNLVGGTEEIAYITLQGDYRFNITKDKRIKKAIIKQYLDTCEQFYFVQNEDEGILGFLGLLIQGNETPFIYLAGVHPKYQAAGIAMALYSHVLVTCKENGYKNVYGRISSSNMAVMNLYSSFGCRFYEPRDIFVR